TVVLTGSSAARFDEARKQLAGRRHAERSDRTLFQMGFVDVARALGLDLPEGPCLRVGELADPGVIDDAVERFRPWIPGLVDMWDRYLQLGGYPQAVDAELTSPGSAGDARLRDALWDVIFGDAFQSSGLTETQTQALLRSLT